ncbi:MAG TPA: sigma-70 family RNA polymerase sigma factor, partial [Firmicutes bacterium]|nr:sigma-70 family RNA polymerase sigma factor [Bacillota bacterium]
MDTWEKLVGRHQADVKTLVLHLLGPEEVEDVTQEVFMRAFRSLSGFRGDCSFATWLYHITVNLCRDRLRRRQT